MRDWRRYESLKALRRLSRQVALLSFHGDEIDDVDEDTKVLLCSEGTITAAFTSRARFGQARPSKTLPLSTAGNRFIAVL